MCPYTYYNIMRKSKDKKHYRYQVVLHAQEKGIKATVRVFATTRNTVRKWLRRWQELGYEGLESQSTKPHYSPRATSHEDNARIVKAKKKYKRVGAEQVKVLEELSQSSKTIRKIWRDAGISSRKRRKKHITKQNLRAVKKEWELFQQIDEDTKYLNDIPEYWPQMEARGLPKIQYTARDVTSGMVYMAFAQERSLTYAILFAKYLNQKLGQCGVDLSKTTRQTDNGAEYIGSWQAKEPSGYTKTIEGVKGQVHSTIPVRAHTFQSDVETVHNLVEIEFYELETFTNRKDFLNKAYTYQLFFNLLRPNSYKENQTPWQIAKKKEPNLCVDIALIPPVLLEDLLVKELDSTDRKMYDFLQEGGHDVSSTP